MGSTQPKRQVYESSPNRRRHQELRHASSRIVNLRTILEPRPTIPTERPCQQDLERPAHGHRNKATSPTTPLEPLETPTSEVTIRSGPATHPTAPHTDTHLSSTSAPPPTTLTLPRFTPTTPTKKTTPDTGLNAAQAPLPYTTLPSPQQYLRPN